MISEKFRRQLRQETELWWQEGLIDASLHEKLAQKYQFADLEGAAKNRFVAILLGLGSILIGLGAITYVAANWQGWPRGARAMLLLSVFIAINAAGFYLLRRSPRRQGRHLGQGLLLLGGLMFGANLGLLSQMFHQSGNLYELYLVWSLGVLAMAYCLRLVSLGVLASILMAIAYSQGVSTLFYGSVSSWRILIEQMPLVGTIAFLPLAYQCRSRVLFTLSAIGISSSLGTNLLLLTSETNAAGFLALATGLPPALLWGWAAAPDALPALPGRDQTETFRPIGKALAILNLSVMAYFLAFHWFWERTWLNQDTSASTISFQWMTSPWVSIGVLWLVAVIGWMQIGRRGWRLQSDRALNSATIAACIGLSSAIATLHQFTALPIWAPIVFNIVLFALALGLIRDGLAFGQRWRFWSGMVLLVLGVLSRTLEYDTDLLLKAAVFTACGTSIILAGLWFERHLQGEHPKQAKRESP